MPRSTNTALSRRPIAKWRRTAPNDPDKLLGRTLRERVVDTDTGEVIADSGALIDETLARKLAGVGKGEFRVQPYVTDDVVYLSADEEEHYVIAQANTPINELGEFIGERVSGRVYDKFLIETVDRVSYMDVFSQAGMWVSRRRSFLSWSMMTPTAPP